MRYIWYIIAGIVGGVFGGMGMGGGTLLIPLLNIFYSVDQYSAQMVNLISFIPMAVVALIIHFKNGIVKYKKVLYFIIPGIATCIGGCFLADTLGNDILKKCFGGFLIALAIFQTILEFLRKKKA